MIKITFVETNCKRNGPIKQTLNIIRHMDRSLFSPTLITIWPEEEGNSMIDEYKALQVPAYCCGLNKVESIFRGKSKVTKLLCQIRPDIVQGVGMPPYRMTLGYKDAVHFITLRNYCYEDYPDQYAKGIGIVMAYMDMQLIRKEMKKGEPFVTCSESLAKIYKEKEKLSIPFIRNGVDMSKYPKRDIDYKENIRRKLSLPTDKMIFLYSGGFIDRKNQKEAIEGFINMKKRFQSVLVLLGDGKDRSELESTYASNNDIFFMGKVDNVKDYLHASDIYLSTSKSEGLPNGVLEAMACGIPIILSDISQHAEILDAGECFGYKYRLGDVNQLSDLMDRMSDLDLYQMGENSYKVLLNNFTAEGMSKQYQNLYKKLINKRYEKSM